MEGQCQSENNVIAGETIGASREIAAMGKIRYDVNLSAAQKPEKMRADAPFHPQ